MNFGGNGMHKGKKKKKKKKKTCNWDCVMFSSLFSSVFVLALHLAARVLSLSRSLCLSLSLPPALSCFDFLALALRSGKSSIQKVVFHKMSPNETLFLEMTSKIVKDGERI